MIDCAQVHGRIREPGGLADLGAGSSGDALEAHLRECPACAELAADGATLGSTLADAELETAQQLSLRELDTMFETVNAEITRPTVGVERLRQLPTRVRSLGMLGVAAALIVLVLVALRRADFSIYPLPRLIGALASLSAAVLAAGAAVLRPLHRRALPGWALGLVAGLAVIAPIVISSLPPAHHGHPYSLLGAGADLIPRALGCFMFGMTFALVSVGAAWMVERSGLRRRGPGVLTLLGAGALGNLVLVLHCPMVAPIHKLLGHATVSLVLLLAAAGLTWGLVRGARGPA